MLRAHASKSLNNHIVMDSRMSKMNVAMVIFFLLNISMMPFISGDLDEAGTDAIARLSRGTIIVDKNGGGDHSTIQAAVNAASPLDTIRVWSGNYAENVVINKDLTLLGNGSATTVIDGGGKGDVLSIRSPHVDISGFRLRNSDSKGSGIDVTNLSHGRISENAITDNHFGMYGGKDCCDNNTIANNTFDHNTKAGIWLRDRKSVV
jgi:pectin methylesterase-like acyl-CoA thioesterase